MALGPRGERLKAAKTLGLLSTTKPAFEVTHTLSFFGRRHKISRYQTPHERRETEKEEVFWGVGEVGRRRLVSFLTALFDRYSSSSSSFLISAVDERGRRRKKDPLVDEWTHQSCTKVPPLPSSLSFG